MPSPHTADYLRVREAVKIARPRRPSKDKNGTQITPAHFRGIKGTSRQLANNVSANSLTSWDSTKADVLGDIVRLVEKARTQMGFPLVPCPYDMNVDGVRSHTFYDRKGRHNYYSIPVTCYGATIQRVSL